MKSAITILFLVGTMLANKSVSNVSDELAFRKFGLEIMFPKEYTLKKSFEGEIDQYFYFRNAPEGASVPSATIVVQDLEEDYSLNEFIEEYKEHFDEINLSYKKIYEAKDKACPLKISTGYYVTGIAQIQGKPIHMDVVFLKTKDQKGISIMFGCSENVYPNYSEEIVSILNTIKYTKK